MSLDKKDLDQFEALLDSRYQKNIRIEEDNRKERQKRSNELEHVQVPYRSKLLAAKEGSKSLKMTIPMEIVLELKLKAGMELRWIMQKDKHGILAILLTEEHWNSKCKTF